jgi:2-phospho-L-lactate guanylyltransferase
VLIEWTVVIPVKGTPDAKSRLGNSPGLSMAIAVDTVEAALAAARVLVVTSADAEPEFTALGALVLQDTGGDLNAAVALGIAAAGAGPVAVLLGDLPALRPEELADALMLAAGHPLAMVPDADAEGTTLITALRAEDHAAAFGVGSRMAHLAAGYVELPLPVTSGLRRDVDTAAQLASLGDRVGERTREALK